MSVLLAALVPVGLEAKTFVVNVVGDQEDPNAGEFNDDNLCDVDPGTPGEQCTLRAAIQNHNANRHLGQNTINIAVPGAAPIIHVTSPLPPVLGSVVIDGVNSGGPGRLEIDGAMAGSDAVGLRLWGGDCIVRFVAIHSFSSHGIHIAGTPPPGGGRHVLEANRIGTDTEGTTDKGNGGDGIYIEDTPGCVIGGAGISKRNIISGNEGYGIHVLGRDPAETGAQAGGAPNTEILGNIIGLDFFESAPLPNTLGGVFIENARDQTVGSTDTGKGNQISGGQTGVKIEGSLANGIKIIGNFIGKDGTGAKFDVGILSRGKLVTIESNAITNVAGVGVDAFLNADGTYNIRKNAFDGKMTIGTKLTFGEGRTITVQYENNVHAENGKAVDFNESVNSTINWNVFGNFAHLGTTGGSMVIKANGNKNFTDNTWELHAEAGFRFIADIDPNVRSIVTIQGEIYDRNGLEGVGVNATVRGELTYVLLRTKSSGSGKDGVLLEAFVGAGAKFSMSGSEMDIRANLEAGIRAIVGETLVPFAALQVDRSLITGNQEDGMVLFGFDLKRSIVDNTITNNGGAGIVLGSNSDARITGNTITGNATGIRVQDIARASITDNQITGNGTAIALAGSAAGTAVSGNVITGSAILGIDLGANGVTPNDPLDADTGANGLQNFPVLTSAVVTSGTVAIAGSLHSAPASVFRIDFYSSATSHSSGYGEGGAFLGSTSVTTDAAGNTAVAATFTGTSVASGAAITATATGPGESTSEFSACVTATPPPADLELVKTVDDATPEFGEQAVFTVTLTNRGPGAAAGVTVVDLPPFGLAVQQVTVSAGSYESSSGRWTLGAMAADTSATLTIVARVEAEGTIVNVAEVTASDAPDPDSTPGNNVPAEDDHAAAAIQTRRATPTQRVTELHADVDQLVQGGVLTSGEGAMLKNPLTVALDHFDDGFTNAAIDEVEDFIAQVSALAAAGRLTVTQAQALSQHARNFLQNLPLGGLANISTRAQVGAAPRQLIAGFVVRGSQPKLLLIRAVGPKLAEFGIGGLLQDPLIDILRGSTLVVANDNWGQADAAAIDAAALRVGAFGFDSGSKDAAVLRTIEPQAHTAVVSGFQGAVGVALVEVYDATESAALSPVERLVNISSRGAVGTGADVLIAGFVINGDVPRVCLLRGVGPKLAEFGVTDVLADPVLELFKGPASIATNDDWETGGSAAAIAAAAAITGAFALDAGSTDAALVLSLTPGAYTLHLRGKDGSTGVALVEIYEM